MNQGEFIEAFGQKVGVEKKEATRLVKAFTDLVTETMVRGEVVHLWGFGHFEKKFRAAHRARNPRNGQPIVVEEMFVPSFRAGTALKEAVRETEKSI